eukprot:CFRG7299T1
MSSKKNRDAKAAIYGQRNQPFKSTDGQRVLKLYVVHAEIGSLQVLSLLRCKRLEHEKVTIDIARERPDWYYALIPSGLAPCLLTEEGKSLDNATTILDYLEERYPPPLFPSVWPSDVLRKAYARRLVHISDIFARRLTKLAMNQDYSQREILIEEYLEVWREIDDFLIRHNPKGVFLYDDVGMGGFSMPEIVFTPLFEANWVNEYYEDFQIPDTLEYTRVIKWRDACLAHNMSSVVTKEEIVKLWYDTVKGVPMGKANPDTTRMFSSYAMEPHWTSRPMPNKNKYNYSCSDGELGLILSSSGRPSPYLSPVSGKFSVLSPTVFRKSS